MEVVETIAAILKFILCFIQKYCVPIMILLSASSIVLLVLSKSSDNPKLHLGLKILVVLMMICIVLTILVSIFKIINGMGIIHFGG